jgi:hypothetical protein
MTIQIKIFENNTEKTVARSHNLRGVLDYARKHPVTKVEVNFDKSEQGYLVHFEFCNGAWSNVQFASAHVAHDWVMARRSWGISSNVKLEPETMYSGSDSGKVTFTY